MLELCEEDSSWDFIHWICGYVELRGTSVDSVWCVQRCVIPGEIISSGEVCEGDEY